MKTAVITGSTKGIGRAIALKLLQEGYQVVVNYASSDVDAEAFAKDAAQYKGKFIIIKECLSSYEEALSFVAKVKKHFKKLDCLVLNSAITDRTPFSKVTHEGWEKVINTNLNVPFYLVQGFSDIFCNDCGRILLIGSICGQYPHAASVAYAVSKAAIHQMAKELVKVFAERKITVNAIVPSFVETPWQQSKSPEQHQRIVDKLSLGRFAYPEEIADFCYSVIQNPYINGSVLNIDGGYCYR